VAVSGDFFFFRAFGQRGSVRLALNGFVFSDSAGWLIVIIHFYKRLYVNMGRRKLALLFQIAFFLC
jgi:hypothetical protein